MPEERRASSLRQKACFRPTFASSGLGGWASGKIAREI